MNKKISIYFTTIVLSIQSLFLLAQVPFPPAVRNDFTKVTSYDELMAYAAELDQVSDLLRTEVIGTSVEGRDILALKFSKDEFGITKDRLKVLIFAQQHGNEQAGKEGALLLAEQLLRPENRQLFDHLDLMLIPQVNPDGSEANKRRNARDMDLNRNHLILTEPETQAVHRVFDRYLFEVTLDVHEYSPYGIEWMQFGYRKNSEVTVGTLTNINIPYGIRHVSEEMYLPFILNYLGEHHFTAFEYLPGGPPDKAYLRRSTFDINDGRQSLGIQNTFSFIQEGMNGEDGLIHNLRRRAEGQAAGMMGLLRFCAGNSEMIRLTVLKSRSTLSNPLPGSVVSIQAIHAADGSLLELPVFSYTTKRDTVITVDNYRPVVKSGLDIAKPYGYLVPKDSLRLVDWARRHNLELRSCKSVKKASVMQFLIKNIAPTDFEGDTIGDPIMETREVAREIDCKKYWLIPTNHMKGNMVIIALEPRSMLGLATYKEFKGMMRKGSAFPVLRVETEKGVR